MIVSISKSISGNDGRQNFLRRLFGVLNDKYGVQLALGKKSDIHLCAPGEIKPGVKSIVRIDGVYYDTARLSMNRAIQRSIAAADGVIYQSHWSRLFAETMLKVANPHSTVVYNGAVPSDYQHRVIDKKGFDKVFLVCSHWRPNKRLRAITDAFISAFGNDRIGLYVVGEPDYKVNHANVVYWGKLQSEKIYKIYASADYFVHICHLDACPNSVVEALVCGLPVLSNNIGGTPEIVQDSGIIANLDRSFEFHPIANMNVVGSASVDQAVLIQSMRDMVNRIWNVYRPEFFIETIAKQYYDFFTRVL